jgi:hypothetical protein
MYTFRDLGNIQRKRFEDGEKKDLKISTNAKAASICVRDLAGHPEMPRLRNEGVFFRSWLKILCLRLHLVVCEACEQKQLAVNRAFSHLPPQRAAPNETKRHSEADASNLALSATAMLSKERDGSSIQMT